jgi:hypothetical protein
MATADGGSVLSVTEAVLLAKRLERQGGGGGGGGGARPVASNVAVVGQVVTRKKVSRRLMFLNLRPATCASAAREVPASKQTGGDNAEGKGGAAGGVFLQLIVKEDGVGAATMDWARQGARQLRLGDLLQCRGALEVDPQAGAAVVLVVGKGLPAAEDDETETAAVPRQGGTEAADGGGGGGGGCCLRVLERFETRNPGCHWEGHLFDAPSAPWQSKQKQQQQQQQQSTATRLPTGPSEVRPELHSRSGVSGGGGDDSGGGGGGGGGGGDTTGVAEGSGIFEVGPLGSIITGGADDVAARYCKFWINNAKCNRVGCRFVHGSAEQLRPARKAYHAARKVGATLPTTTTARSLSESTITSSQALTTDTHHTLLFLGGAAPHSGRVPGIGSVAMRSPPKPSVGSGSALR